MKNYIDVDLAIKLIDAETFDKTGQYPKGAKIALDILTEMPTITRGEQGSVNSVEPVSFRIGKNIRLVRKSKGWTQERLGKECNVGVAAISHIENGADCHLSTILLIADALEVDLVVLA